jgi:RNA polymerase sigma factor (sigma-70 family)
MSQVVQHLRRAARLPGEPDLTDGQLLACFIARRDEEAFGALVRRHGPMVWGVCRRVLGCPHDAEDAFQATFLVLVRKAGLISSRELLANWLYGVAHRTALHAKITNLRRRAKERQVASMPERAAQNDLERDLVPLLDRQLSRLAEKYRVPIILCDLEGKTRKEAAQQLGVPEGTVAGRLARARAMLARNLTRHGLPVSGATLAVLLANDPASASLPAAVVAATVRAAAGVAGAITPSVLNLVNGVMKGMLMSKIKASTAALFLAAAVVGSVAVGLAHSVTATPADPETALAVPEGQPAKEGKTAGVAARTAGPPHWRVEHASPVTCLAWSADGAILATGNRDGTVVFADAATGKEIRRFNAGAAVAGLAFSADGKTLVVSDATQQLRCWAVATGKANGNELTVGGVFERLAFTPDGRSVLAVAVGQYLQWQLGAGLGGMGMAMPQAGGLAEIAADGSVGGWCDARGLLYLRPVGGQMQALKLDAARAIAFGPAGKLLAVGDRVDIKEGAAGGGNFGWGGVGGAPPKGGGGPPPGKGGGKGGGGVIGPPGGGPGGGGAAPGKGGMGGAGGAPAGGVMAPPVPGAGGFPGGPGGGGPPGGAMPLPAPGAGGAPGAAGGGGAGGGGAGGPGGGAGGGGGGPPGFPGAGGPGGGGGGAVPPAPGGWGGPGGQPAVIDVPDKGVLLWDLAARKKIAVLPGLDKPVSRLAFAGDGKSLAALTTDGQTVQVWELQGHTAVCQVNSRGGALTLVAMAPDGKALAAASADGKAVLLWRVAARQVAHKGPAVEVAGKELAALWQDLANADPAKQDAAWQKLGAAGDGALDFLRQQVRQVVVTAVDLKHLERLVAELDAEKFAVREKAARDLQAIGEPAVAALQRLLASKPSAEAEQRAKAVLQKIAEPAFTPDQQRVLEVLDLLEQLGTPKAIALLEEIQRDAQVRRVQAAAQSAMQRLGRSLEAKK